MYSELIIRPQSLTNQRIYAADARRMIAKAMDGAGPCNALFGREESQTGLSVGEFSPVPVIFDGGTGFIRIYGIGKRGENIVLGAAGYIHRALANYLKTIVKVDIRGGSHQRIREHQMVTYNIAKLGLAKPGKKRMDAFISEDGRRKDPDLSEIIPLIRDVIDRGIIDMATQLDRDDVDKAILPTIPSDLRVTIHSGQPAVFQVHPDRPGHIMGVRNLKFSMLGLFQGPWAVGHLRSHGHGLIKLVRGE